MSLRENQKALAGLIRRGLSSDAKTTPDCPGPDELAAYYEKSLPSAEAARFENHFSNCAHCRMQLAAVARADESIGQTKRKPWLLLSLGKWRWLTPAAAALAGFLVWFGLHLHRGSLLEQAKGRAEVAMNAPSSVSAPALQQPADTLTATPSPTAEKKIEAPKEPKREVRVETSEGRPSLPGAAAHGASEQSAPVAGFDRTPLKQKKGLVAKVPNGASPTMAGAAAPPIPPSTVMDEAVEVVAPSTPPPKAAPTQAARAPVSKEEANANKPHAAASLTGNAMRAARSPMQVLEVRSAENVIANPENTILWRVGPSGSIERSDDGGATWQKQFSGISEDLLAGSAPSSKTCWVVGRAGIVLRTTDGRTWRQLLHPTDTDLVDVHAQNSRQATVRTADGRSFLTADAGETWQPKE